MALILDQINGVRNDHRLENLRIVCPNCNATLPTHCGKRRRSKCASKRCFNQAPLGKKYCGRKCFFTNREPQFHRRKVVRPTFDTLKKDIEESSFVAVGVKYGVSDNCIRQWVRTYEANRERVGVEGLEPTGTSSQSQSPYP